LRRPGRFWFFPYNFPEFLKGSSGSFRQFPFPGGYSDFPITFSDPLQLFCFPFG
jgi:hypothetical protein